MDKIKNRWTRRRPSKRRLVQLYAALLYNAHLKGFITGEIFTGATKALCVPGLNCYSCPGAIGACPLGALQNALSASGKRAPFYIFGILALFGLIFGRTICGWLCPVGLIQELLHKIPTPKLKKGRVTRALSHLKYLILAYFVIAIPLLHISDGVPVPGFCKYICPAGTLEGAVLLVNSANAKLSGALGLLFTRKLVIMAAIFTLSVFVYRLFCRFLCPLGAIYSLFSRFALLGVQVDARKCTGCGRCVASCEMDVKRVGDRECIQCGRCAQICPTKAISWKHGKVRVAGNEIAGTPKKKADRRILNIAIAVLAALVLAAAIWYGNFSDAAGKGGRVVGAEPGMRCPDFEVPLCGEAGSVALDDCLGRPTVINFWATWCGGCCAELPEFQRFSDAYGDRINLIAVHSAEVTDDVEAFIADHGYTFRFALDADDAMIPAFGGANALPQTVILDRNGTVVCSRVGSVSYDFLESVAAPLLDAPPAAEAVTAEEPAGEAADYVIVLTDQNGNGVADAKLQVCTDAQCRIVTTDQSGVASFRDAPCAYEVRIFKLPEGYAGDLQAVYALKPEGDCLELHAEGRAE